MHFLARSSPIRHDERVGNCFGLQKSLLSTIENILAVCFCAPWQLEKVHGQWRATAYDVIQGFLSVMFIGVMTKPDFMGNRRHC